MLDLVAAVVLDGMIWRHCPPVGPHAFFVARLLGLDGVDDLRRLCLS